MSTRQTIRFASLAAVAAVVAACSSTKPAPEPEPTLPVTPGMNLTAMMRLCPQAMLDDDQTFTRVYSPANAKTPENLVYQASLTDYSRACSVAPTNDGLLVQISVAGRLIGGPKAKPGVYKVPVRVEIVDGSTALYDQVMMKDVELPAEGMSTQFLFDASNLPVPMTAGENTRVRVGIAK